MNATETKGTSMSKKLLLSAVLIAGSTGLAWGQDLAAGAKVFKQCATCHDVGERAKNKVGPELNGLDGRKSGSVKGYNYSSANKNADIVWNEATFLEYIKNPKAMMPGNKMPFAGLRKEEQAKDLWAYLKQYGPDGKKK